MPLRSLTIFAFVFALALPAIAQQPAAPNGGAAPAQQSPAYGGELPAKPAPSAVTQEVKLLPAPQVAAIFPEKVYFAGQTASVQQRNSAGIQWQDGLRSMFALVDTAGYSSSIQQKYQAYLLTDVAMEIGGKLLPAGAYGVGFEDGGGFVVMDVGGHDVFVVKYARDDKMARPTPLQVVRNPETGVYFFYEGRNCVPIARAGQP